LKPKERWRLEALAKFKEEFKTTKLGLSSIEASCFEIGFRIGFELCREKLLDLCDAKNEYVTFSEINRIGER